MSKTNPQGLYWADPLLLAAQSMHACDRELRAASRRGNFESWLCAGVDFIRTGLRHNCLDQLNELAEVYGGNTRLSERSMDELFESGDQTDAFVARLRLEADADPTFAEQVRAYFGDRIFTRELVQEGLFA